MSLTVKQARVMSDISQQKMAELLGIHVQTYRKIENNPSLATIGQAKIISKATNVTIEQIFF